MSCLTVESRTYIKQLVVSIPSSRRLRRVASVQSPKQFPVPAAPVTSNRMLEVGLEVAMAHELG